MDFKHAKRNRRLDLWIVVTLIFSFSLGLNFLISQIDVQLDLSPGQKYSLSKESIALLNRMEQPVDLIITIPENSRMPKIMQKFMHDLELLTDALERADTPHPIQVHRVDVFAQRKNKDILDKYKVSQPNLLIAASPKNGPRIIFRYKEESGVSHITPTNLFDPPNRLQDKLFGRLDFILTGKKLKMAF